MPTLVVGLGALALLVISKAKLGAWLVHAGMSAVRAVVVIRVMPLVVVLLGTLTVIGLELDLRFGVAVVGRVREGLPGFDFSCPH